MIIDNQLKPGDRLPSEKELVQQLGVSRSTVRDALARLATEGIIDKRWGVGTFVAETKPPTASGILSINPGVPGLLASTGGTPSVYSLTFSKRPPDPELFPDFPDTPTYSVIRVFALNGVPAIAIRDRIVSQFAGRIIDPSALQSVDVLVPDIFEAVGIKFVMINVTLWASTLDKEGRSIFGLLKPEPVIDSRGEGFDADGRRILIVRGTYRTRVVTLSYQVT